MSNTTDPEVIKAVAASISDLLEQLGLKPDERPADGGESIGETVAHAAINSMRAQNMVVLGRSRWAESEHFGRERGPLDMPDIVAELRRDQPPSGLVLVDEAILRGQANSLSSVSVPLAALAQLRQSWEGERIDATETNRALVIAHRNEVLLAREVDVLRCELERIKDGMRKLVDPAPALPLGGGEDYTAPRE